jgi:hypothetical protein
MAVEAGLPDPVMLTAAAWADCVAWDDADTERTGCPQDQDGRLWDVLWMTRYALAAGSPRVQLYRVSRGRPYHEDEEPELVELRMHAATGHAGRRTLVLALADEPAALDTT